MPKEHLPDGYTDAVENGLRWVEIKMHADNYPMTMTFKDGGGYTVRRVDGEPFTTHKEERDA